MPDSLKACPASPTQCSSTDASACSQARYKSQAVAAGVHHETGLYVGTGPTEAAAIEAAFVKLRRALLPAPIQQYLQEIETQDEAKEDTEDDQ